MCVLSIFSQHPYSLSPTTLATFHSQLAVPKSLHPPRLPRQPAHSPTRSRRRSALGMVRSSSMEACTFCKDHHVWRGKAETEGSRWFGGRGGHGGRGRGAVVARGTQDRSRDRDRRRELERLGSEQDVRTLKDAAHPRSREKRSLTSLACLRVSFSGFSGSEIPSCVTTCCSSRSTSLQT